MTSQTDPSITIDIPLTREDPDLVKTQITRGLKANPKPFPLNCSMTNGDPRFLNRYANCRNIIKHGPSINCLPDGLTKSWPSAGRKNSWN